METTDDIACDQQFQLVSNCQHPNKCVLRSILKACRVIFVVTGAEKSWGNMSERAKAAIEAAKKRSAEVQQRLPQPEGRLERLKLFLDQMDLKNMIFRSLSRT